MAESAIVEIAMTDDRRQNDRAPIVLKVEYQRMNSLLAEYASNISSGGTFIRTDKVLPVGTEFVFELNAPRLAAPLQIRGVVKWVRTIEDAGAEPPGMGIEFVYASAAERVALQRTLEALMMQEFGSEVTRKLLKREK